MCSQYKGPYLIVPPGLISVLQLAVVQLLVILIIPELKRCKATVIVSRLGLLRLATLRNMTERGYNAPQRDFNMSKRGTAWLKRGATRAGMLKIHVNSIHWKY